MKKTLSALSIILALSATTAFATEPTAIPPAKGDEHKGGKMFKETDGNSDGSISKDEWRTRGDKMFGEMDTSGDGKLTHEEMKAHYDKKRAEWKDRREERKEKIGAMKEKLKERQENKAAPATPAAEPAKQ
jgi:hypothetical protein